jgi:hypothetical protein
VRRAAGILLAGAALAAGCGDGDAEPSVGGQDKDQGSEQAQAQAPGQTTTVERTTRVEVLKQARGGGFDPRAIYDRVGPGVVEIVSIIEAATRRPTAAATEVAAAVIRAAASGRAS